MEPETQPRVVVSPQSSQVADPQQPNPTESTQPVVNTAGTAQPDNQSMPSEPKEVEFAWEADEFEQTVRTSTWYGALTLAAIVTAIITFILTGKDFFSASAVLTAVMGLAFLASRKPKRIQIGVDTAGIYIGRHFYSFHDYRSFSTEHKGQPSALFMPLKRFAPPLAVLLDPTQADEIVTYMSAFVPLQDHQPDIIEKLMSRLHL